MKKVSIGIITRNREKFLQKCLRSIQKQNRIYIQEVLIVDNDSYDSTSKVATSFKNDLPIRYIKEKKIGIPFARNRILQEARGALLLFIDDDCEASPTWIEEMVKTHKKYPRAAAIQGKAIFVPKESIFAKFFTVGYDFWIWRSRINKEYITICDTSNLLIQREKILSLGIKFDTNFTRGSDVDFSRQLLAQKQQIVYAEQAIVLVFVRTNIPALYKQRYLMGVASKQLENKWGIPEKLPDAQDAEYRNRSEQFYNELSLGQKLLFHFYKPLYQLGRKRLKVEVKKERVVQMSAEFMKKRSDITIGIVTRNRKMSLKRCLQSIVHQTVLPSEVIIVENASFGEQPEPESFPFALRYIYEERIGIANARNRALVEAKGKLLAFIDDDCEASPTWIEEMMRAHKKHPKAAAVQGKCLVYPSRGVISAVMQCLYDFGIQKNLYGKKLFTLDTANVLLQVEYLRKNAIIFRSLQYYGEDIDLCYQLWYHGENVLYESSMVVYSWRRFSKISLLKQSYYKGLGRSSLDKRWSASLHNSVFVLNGTKHNLSPAELQEHTKVFSTMKFSSKNLWYGLKGSLFLYLLRLFFKISYLHGLKIPETILVEKKYVVSPVPICIGIITRNRAQNLQRLLESLQKQTMYSQEVLVVDNDSSDNTKHIVLSFQKKLPIRYIQEKTVGIPYARNRVLQEAKGELLAFIDDDCEASPTWIEDMIRAQRRYPQAVAIQGKCVYTPEHTIKASVVALNYLYWLQLHIYQKNKLLVLDTKNVLLRLDKIKAFGIKFDTRYKIGDDVDFGKQILTKKQEIRYEKRFVIYHSEKKSIRNFLKNYYLKGRDKAFTEYKWPEQPRKSLQLHREKENTLRVISERFTVWKKLIFILLYKLSIGFFLFGYRTNQYNQLLLHIKQPKKPNADFSIGIVTKDRTHNLYRCLFSLVKQSYRPKEILVIDSSLNRETAAVIRQFKKNLPIKYIYEKAQGISHARNTAIKKANGEIFAFIDDDCEASPTWIEEMMKAHRTYPQATAIQGKVFFVPFRGLISKIIQDTYYNWIKLNVQKNGDFFTLDFENTSFKRALLRDADIWCDMRYERNYYCEDVDFGYQLLYASKIIKYYPFAYVLSKRKESLLSLLTQRWLKGRSRATVDLKWKFIRNARSFYLKDRQIVVRKTIGLIKDNPYFVDTRHHVYTILLYFYPVIEWLFEKAYRLGYFFERVRFEHDYKRLSHSYLPQSIPIKKECTVSVMIITKDRNTLSRALDSLVIQTQLPKEVIIIDSSLYSVEKKIQKYKKKLQIIYVYQAPQGFGIARNTAMRKASGDIVATLDDDGQSDRFWIERIKKAHLVFPDALVVQGRVISMPKDSIISLVEQLYIERWFLRQLDHDNRFYTLSTKNISIKREKFFSQKLKFVENKLYGLYGSEDVDLAYKIRQKKSVIMYEPSIRVFHWERGSIQTYLQQQYRKGMASVLIGKDWHFLIKKRKPFLPLPEIVETVVLVMKNEVSRKKFYLYPTIFFVFYIANRHYKKGRGKMTYVIAKMSRNIFSSAPVSVIIFYRNNFKNLYQQLYALAHQSLYPATVVLVTNLDYKNYQNIISLFTFLFPILYIPLGNRRMIKDAVENKRNGKLVAFLDEYTIPSFFWLEEIVKVHKKYPDTVIQGITKLSKTNDIYSTIMQFQRQSLIRIAMGRYKNLYWKWVNGEVNKKFYVYMYDISTISIKNDKKILQSNNSIEFLISLGNQNGYTLMDKMLVVASVETARLNMGDFKTFVHQAYSYGKFYGVWYDENFHPLKKTLAFMYYCLKNGRIFSLPLALLYFLIFQSIFFYAIWEVKRNALTNSQQRLVSV